MIFLGKAADYIGIEKTVSYLIILIFAVSILLTIYFFIPKKMFSKAPDNIK